MEETVGMRHQTEAANPGLFITQNLTKAAHFSTHKVLAALEATVNRRGWAQKRL